MLQTYGESMLGEEEKRGFGALLINEKRRKGGEGHLFPHLSAGFDNIKKQKKTFGKYIFKLVSQKNIPCFLGKVVEFCPE